MDSKFKNNDWGTGARRLGAITMASILLAACGGGSGGGGSGVALPGSGAQASGAATAPAGGASATTTSTPTLKEQIAALERSGAYPALDRSADIAGPDANTNGVRDDIEAWINAQQVSDAQKKALMQDARATQRTLIVDLNDKAALQRTGEGLSFSTKCGGDSFPKRSDFYPFASKIEAMTANTRQRAEQYMKYNAARSGSSTTSPNGNTCDP